MIAHIVPNDRDLKNYSVDQLNSFGAATVKDTPVLWGLATLATASNTRAMCSLRRMQISANPGRITDRVSGVTTINEIDVAISLMREALSLLDDPANAGIAISLEQVIEATERMERYR